MPPAHVKRWPISQQAAVYRLVGQLRTARPCNGAQEQFLKFRMSPRLQAMAIRQVGYPTLAILAHIDHGQLLALPWRGCQHRATRRVETLQVVHFIVDAE